MYGSCKKTTSNVTLVIKYYNLFFLFQLVVNLALVIYHALDYTHSEDEERLISPDLEGLITEMTACEAPGKLEC